MEISLSKHKLMILALKMLPAFMAGSYLASTITNYFGLGLQVFIHFSGMVVAPILFMYIASSVFHFCAYHRLFIHYVLITEMLTTLKWYFPFILTSQVIINSNIILTSILIICTVIYHSMKLYKKRRPS